RAADGLEAGGDLDEAAGAQRQLAHVAELLDPGTQPDLEAGAEVGVAAREPRVIGPFPGRAVRGAAATRPVIEALEEGGRHQVELGMGVQVHRIPRRAPRRTGGAPRTGERGLAPPSLASSRR